MTNVPKSQRNKWILGSVALLAAGASILVLYAVRMTPRSRLNATEAALMPTGSWSAVSEFSGRVPPNLKQLCSEALRSGESWESTGSVAIERVNEWARLPENSNLAPVVFRDAYEPPFLGSDGSLPYFSDVLTAIRLSFVLAIVRFQQGLVEEAEQWFSSALNMIARLGEGRSIVEKRAAVLELGRWISVAQSERASKHASELASCLHDLDRNRVASSFDIPSALRYMASWYRERLLANDDSLDNVEGLSIPFEVNRTALSEEVERVLRGMAEAWQSPDALSHIKSLEQSFRFQQARVLVSGIDRVYREVHGVESQLDSIEEVKTKASEDGETDEGTN